MCEGLGRGSFPRRAFIWISIIKYLILDVARGQGSLSPIIRREEQQGGLRVNKVEVDKGLQKLAELGFAKS